MLNQLRSMELGRCLKHVFVISVIVLIVHVNGGLSLAYRHANVTTRCVEREREALLAIKRDLVDEYNRLSSWGDAQNQQDCCTWKGVHCHNRTGHVVQLRLGAINGGEYDGELQGTLSPKLAELHHLTYLDLSSNDFNMSQIPAFIGSLTHLKYLDLSWAGFGGEIPYHQLGNLTHLQYLNLAYNDFTHAVENLNWLPNLSSLKYLDLSNMNLSKVSDWLESVNKLPNLRNLTLNYCELPPPILSTFSHINSSNSLAQVVWSGNPDVSSSILIKWLSNHNTTLFYLDLSDNDLNGSQIPAFIGTLTNLRYLDWFTPAVVENLNWLPRLSFLKYLHLSGTNLSKVSDWLESVNKLPNLRNLTLSYCDLPPPILSTISHKHSSNSLAKIDLSDNPGVTSSILLKWLSNYNTTIVHLDLSYTELSGIPDVISNMSSLAHLDLSANQISGGLIPNVFRNLSSLAHLDLSDNPLGGGFPKSLGQLCSLQYLAISNCSMHGQLSEFVQSMPICARNSLQTLELSNNNLTGSIPSLSNFLSLEYLYLAENQLSGMTHDSIGNLSSLIELSLGNNRLSGLIPESMGQLSSLEILYLHGNQLSGRIPETIGQLSRLQYMDLSGNSLTGVISETHFSKLSKLEHLDLSSNLLSFNFTSDWVPPFQLWRLILRSCKVGPYFPKWLRTQTRLAELDLSHAGISNVVPNWFVDHFDQFFTIDLSHNQIRAFEDSNLSHNQISGLEKLYLRLYLSSNQLEGSVPLILSQTRYLDLSNNKFSNMTSFLCDSKVTFLGFLNLSSNHFSGELPDCWRHFVYLRLLDLSNNDFSGELPISIGSLSFMETLNLRTNKFVGELPSSLKNCTNLTVIDLGYNKLSMSLPAWLGASFPNLVILMLQSNHFNGSIPSQLCHLSHIQILDLSLNEISGTIPRCLDSLTSLTQEGNSSLTIEHRVANSSYETDATFMWKGVMSSYKSTLGLVKRIDLSSNRLMGGIPSEITHLVGLVSLNLSRNHLTGKIPQDIGKLQSLDNIDLSRNQLDGKIPTSLAQIHRLTYLNLSYNQLSGEIPTGTQLQSFDPLFYAGNPLLCGLPLKKCISEDTRQDRQNVLGDDEDSDELITQGFFITMGLGFAAGFWGVCGSLIFKRSWRYAYYKFLTALYDWLYVKVALVGRQMKDMVQRIA